MNRNRDFAIGTQCPSSRYDRDAAYDEKKFVLSTIKDLYKMYF